MPCISNKDHEHRVKNLPPLFPACVAEPIKRKDIPNIKEGDRYPAIEAMKKEAKRKARIEQRRAKRSSNSPKLSEEKEMHDIDKPITLEDLTNPDKN